MNITGSSVWTDDMDDALRAHWAAGHSTTKIAELLNEQFGKMFTKNSIIGRSHRIGGIEKRMAFYNRTGQKRVSKPKVDKAALLTQPLTNSKTALRQAQRASGVMARKAALEARRRADQTSLFTRLSAPFIPPRTSLPRHEKTIPIGSKSPNRWPAHCCWIYGDPRKDGVRFCDMPRQEHKPYCGEHAAICFVPNEKRPEAA